MPGHLLPEALPVQRILAQQQWLDDLVDLGLRWAVEVARPPQPTTDGLTLRAVVGDDGRDAYRVSVGSP